MDTRDVQGFHLVFLGGGCVRFHSQIPPVNTLHASACSWKERVFPSPTGRGRGVAMEGLQERRHVMASDAADVCRGGGETSAAERRLCNSRSANAIPPSLPLGSFPPLVAMVTLALPHGHFGPPPLIRPCGGGASRACVDQSDLRDLVPP